MYRISLLSTLGGFALSMALLITAVAPNVAASVAEFAPSANSLASILAAKPIEAPASNVAQAALHTQCDGAIAAQKKADESGAVLMANVWGAGIDDANLA